MLKATLYNMKGEKEKEIDIPESLFGVNLNQNLLYQVVRTQSLIRRQNSAHTKDRSAVRGGGRKPWRQKGTGRARHGSNRSPIWKGGGVTFGPDAERNYKKKINKKVKRKALAMVLSAKKEKDMIVFVSDLELKEPKTKVIQEFLKNFELEKSTLFVLPKMEENLILATRNLQNISTIQAKDINSLDLLSYRNLVISEDAVAVIKENFKL